MADVRRCVVSLVVALLAAGLLVAGTVRATRAEAATPSTLTAPARLTAGQFIRSANDNFKFVMQGDGNLVLYSIQGNALWSSRTGGHPGSFFAVQGDGNLVIYSPGRGAIWSSRSNGKGGTRLIMQGDGNVVLYTPAGKAVWASGTVVPTGSNNNPLPRATLRAAATLQPGQRLVSPNGAYQAVMQGDGNFVVYASGRATWSTGSWRWHGAYLAMQSDGNLVLYADGTALWSSRTGGTRANQLIMGNDGDLRLYDPPGHVLWQSRGAAIPTIPPPVATSHYVRADSDPDQMHQLGCADARANPGGGGYAIVLTMGAQHTDVDGEWGVWLTTTSTQLTDAQVVASVGAYVDGYAGCMAASAPLRLVVATNNDSQQYGTNCPRPPAGKDDPLGGPGGTDWARHVIAPLAGHAATTKRPITVAGGNDIEAGFSGCESQAEVWLSAYLAAGSSGFSYVGSADGCPRTLGHTACSFGWTQLQYYQLAYGKAPSRMVPLPQIYSGTLAQQWAAISATGVAARHPAIRFGGPLTEHRACEQAGGCSSITGPTAWNTFRAWLSARANTRIPDMPYSTDLEIS